MMSVFLRFPDGREKAVTFSYDDGAPSDRRLAALFDQYGLKGTFNFNSDCLRKVNFTKEEIKEIFLDKGHEIAIHGEMHRANGNTRPIEGIRDVLNCRLELEDKCDRIIRGMAYPDSGITRIHNFGTYEDIKHYLTELDIAYARTLGANNTTFELPTDFHAWMPTGHHKDAVLPALIDEFLQMDVSIKAYHSTRSPRLLYIWGHSFEFERDNNWDLMEGICQKVSGRDNIWYATNIDIYDYVQAFRSLQYSADAQLVYNPTLLTVWFLVDSTLYHVEPGETLHLRHEHHPF